jgi:transposase
VTSDKQEVEADMNANVKVTGLDIAKNVFLAVGQDDHGKMVWKRKLSRVEVLPTFANMSPMKIGIEACAGLTTGPRKLIELGHDVKLIAAQHTRKYVTANKNDTNDAAAIAEARSRVSTKTVPINTEAQQDLQMLHRARQALMKERTGMICRIRAFAGEYGQVFALGVAKFHEGFCAWMADPQNGLSGSAVATLRELKEQLDDKETRIAVYDKRLHQAAKDAARAKQLQQVPGIGPIIATAVLAAVADPHHFKSGRDFAANLGLTPSEHSSGGKQRLGSITGRGDSYLRTLFIHGARSALRHAADKPDRLLRWATNVSERRAFNVASVALANKMARVVWALLEHGHAYDPVWSKSTTRPA